MKRYSTLPHSRNAAFTLVELAIVLVIVGLLIGGILAGQSMIRSSQIKRAVNDMLKYEHATQAFRERHLELPGDFSLATDNWGRADTAATGIGVGQCAAPDTDTNSGPPTCNGNGNGRIDGGTDAYQESYRAWEHLVASGFMIGTFSGIKDPASTPLAYGMTINLNIPSLGMDNVGALLRHRAYNAAASGDFWEAVPYNNHITVGAVVSYWPNGGFLKPEELKGIDQKIDDGSPVTGKLIAIRNTNCVTSLTKATTAYNLQSTGTGCSFNYLLGY